MRGASRLRREHRMVHAFGEGPFPGRKTNRICSTGKEATAMDTAKLLRSAAKPALGMALALMLGAGALPIQSLAQDSAGGVAS